MVRRKKSSEHSSRFSISPNRQLVLDGEGIEGTKVDESGRRPEITLSIGSLDKVMDVTLEEFSTLFETITIPLIEAEPSPSDWCFPKLVIFLDYGEAPAALSYAVNFNIALWANNYSLTELAATLRRTIEDSTHTITFWQDETFTSDSFGLEIDIKSAATIREVLALNVDVDLIVDSARKRLESPKEENAVSVVFNFPPTIKSTCEQYLNYFGQFLSDLGIDAHTELKEQAHSVLFSIIPTNADEALDNIREALQIYLGLANATRFTDAASAFTDLAVTQLQANVLHLQSQIMMAKAAIAMQNATLEAKEERIALLQDRLDLRSFQPPLAIEKNSNPKEDVISGLVSVKTWDY
ncbi:MAG TPA: hypothetical protein VIM67_09545, partial [Terriglobus sp.]